ncbi:hypothetical protein ULMS_19230 [Patiriisocius marinistellae]|uniref:Uncharacterized protein n=1 Tax=Patiriisocius marinistellae TaxID=2494560 RepID=A0A5J4G1Q8_9FLAO|nr:hypothetical protein [Patiriisocius marinistellae]GEQ86415.1 hypothetical protein ULMS_19230 [Patiriisocius marinistellae]
MDTSKKDHADFQSDYRQSSNFNAEARDENLEVAKNGNVKLSEKPLSETDKQKIADAMDNMRNKIENTGERVSRREEE